MKSDSGSTPNADTPLDWSLVQRVLLIRLRSIGDTVLMTPCLAALKAWRPDLEITVVSEPLAAPLLENHPLVDDLIIAEGSLSSRSALISKLRKARFGAAFNMHGGPTGALLARLAGSTQSVGYQGQALSWLLSRRAPAPDVILGRSRIHSVEQQLALLNWTGVPLVDSRPQLSLHVNPEIEQRVRTKLESLGGHSWKEILWRGFGCIMPGAAFESKRWNAEGFACAADHLRERWNLPCVIVAGPGQEELARQVASKTLAQTPVVDGLSLKELVALLAMTRVFVGNDSGPMHIAAALERPIVAVWGSSDQSVWHPWTEAPWRIISSKSTPAQHDLCEANGGIKSIGTDEVITAVDEVLELALEANHAADQQQGGQGRWN